MLSAIGSIYVDMVIDGRRRFDQVPMNKKQEVADELIRLGREDLITIEEYLPEVEVPEVEPEAQENK